MNLNSICSIEGARAALNIGGTIFGFYLVRVLPSKTVILPVNLRFLPRVSPALVSCFATIKYSSILNMLILVFCLAWPIDGR